MKKFKKGISIISIFSLLLILIPTQTIHADAPIQISNWQELAEINNNLTADYILTADLDQNSEGYLDYASGEANGGAGWLQIGTLESRFEGEFNGNNHSISDLYFNRPDEPESTYPTGLFSATAETATIKNLSISGDVTGYIYSALLVGYNGGTIINVSAEGTAAGISAIGAITGSNEGLISNSFTNVNVTADVNSGTFAGENNGGTITKSYSTGSITGQGDGQIGLGSFVGYNSSEINNSFSTGNTTAINLAGGFVGFNTGGTIINCYSIGEVTANGNLVGGLVGLNTGTFTNSFYNSDTTEQVDITKGTPKTTEELKTIATFTTDLEEEAWDFDTIWIIDPEINNGYPYLFDYEEEQQEPEDNEEEEQPIRKSSSGGTKKTNNNETNTETPSELTYQQEIQAAVEKKLVTENLDSITNKCEALTMIGRAFNWQIPNATTSKYTDVPEWCTSIADYGTKRGIVEGRSATTLGMETPVTRYEIALMLYRELKLQNFPFTDFSNVRHIRFAGFEDALIPWAEEAVNTLHQENIIKGFPNSDPNSIQTLFKGSENILKQDFAVILLRTINSAKILNIHLT